MKNKIALFDMDGTLFDHNQQLLKDMKSCTPVTWHDFFDNAKDFHDLEDNQWVKKLMDLIRTSPGWWRSLPKFQLGWDVYEIAKEIGYCSKILTKGPKTKPIAWMEKVQCIHDHFGDSMSIDIVGKDKGGTYGRVLVDDYPAYLRKWLEHRPRGLAIMPAHKYNVDFTHENLIRYDGTNLEEVKRALQAAWNRDEKEHWRDFLGTTNE